MEKILGVADAKAALKDIADRIPEANAFERLNLLQRALDDLKAGNYAARRPHSYHTEMMLPEGHKTNVDEALG